jgi:cytochrome c oxidase assembly factor CtaG
VHAPVPPAPAELDWTAAWSFEPAVVIPMAVALRVYLVGWKRLRDERHPYATARQAWYFGAGIATLLLALCSPIDALAGVLLSVHMTQHLLLMWVAPPLLWLGQPLAPLLRGFPRRLASVAVKALAWPPLRRAGRLLTHPATTWLAFVAVIWAWHAPVLYERALRSDAVHHLEHACFLVAALLFWWPVVEPWPSRPAWPRWAMIPYLALADVSNTALCGLLTFAERVFYPSYAQLAGARPISPLEDQATAGALMWVPGSAVFLIALGAIVKELLKPARRVASSSIGKNVASG